MSDAPHTTVFLYIDDDEHPVAQLESPILFELDTTKLTDGDHKLKLVSKFGDKEGIKIINFTVANGPIIHIEGMKDEDRVNGVVPLMLNAYNTGNNESFIIRGSENPRIVPVWVWVFILVFAAWGIFYLVNNFTINPNDADFAWWW